MSQEAGTPAGDVILDRPGWTWDTCSNSDASQGAQMNDKLRLHDLQGRSTDWMRGYGDARGERDYRGEQFGGYGSEYANGWNAGLNDFDKINAPEEFA